MTTYEKNISQLVESAQYAVDPKLFLRDCLYIKNENTAQKIKWQPWPYLFDLIDILSLYQEVDIAKARQLGVSWAIMAYGLWKVLFNDTAKNLYLSQGEEEAWELIAKTKYMIDHLPDYLKKPLQLNGRGWLTFKDDYSEIKALPSTERAGSGYSATLVVRDELYNHPEGEANFAYISPAIDAGGQLINLSAVYGDNMANHFVVRITTFYNHSGTVKGVYPSGLELYTNPTMPSRCLIFLNWKLRPVRLEGMTLEDFKETRLKPRYTEHQLERQYPESLEQCLTVARSGAYFDMQALNDMGYELSAPIVQKDIDTRNGIIRIYRLPERSRRYVVYTDPSDGVGDPFVTGVMDYMTGEVVASASGKEKVDQAAEIHDYLVRTYCNAMNSWEANAVGIAFEQCIQRLGTPNLVMRKNPAGVIVEGKYGIYVEGQMKNKVLFPDMAFAIAHRQLVVHDREFLQQAKAVSRGGDKPETPRGQSFDWVMMMVGLWQICKDVPTTPYRAYTIDL